MQMLRHLLDIKSLRREQLAFLLFNARSFLEVSERELKKVPALRGKTVINLFLEPSTRTRTSFEIAGKRLSADVINISEGTSSVSKGETLVDTARNLQAMCPDVLVVRHRESGAPHLLARTLTRTAVINAGDGMHEHPTQALLDCLTLLEHFSARRIAQEVSSPGTAPRAYSDPAFLEPLQGLTVAIVGDIRHSRVARSNIYAHLLLGNRIRLVGPPTLVPAEFTAPRFLSTPEEKLVPAERRGSVELFNTLDAGLEGADVVMCLRMQLERQNEHYVPSLTEYSRFFCVNERILSRTAPHCVVLHPGPMNRGTEVSSEVADGPRSLVSSQVTHGVAVRMASLFALATGSITVGESEEARA